MLGRRGLKATFVPQNLCQKGKREGSLAYLRSWLKGVKSTGPLGQLVELWKGWIPAHGRSPVERAKSRAGGMDLDRVSGQTKQRREAGGGRGVLLEGGGIASGLHGLA